MVTLFRCINLQIHFALYRCAVLATLKTTKDILGFTDGSTRAKQLHVAPLLVISTQNYEQYAIKWVNPHAKLASVIGTFIKTNVDTQLIDIYDYCLNVFKQFCNFLPMLIVLSAQCYTHIHLYVDIHIHLHTYVCTYVCLCLIQYAVPIHLRRC